MFPGRSALTMTLHHTQKNVAQFFFFNHVPRAGKSSMARSPAWSPKTVLLWMDAVLEGPSALTDKWLLHFSRKAFF